MHNSGAIIQALQKDNRALGASSRVSAQVFFNDGGIDITGVINGLEVKQEVQLFHFGDYIIEGKVMDIKNVSNSIILGKSLAERLLVRIGDVVQATTPKGDIFPLKVVGYFQLGLLDFDRVQSFASLGTVQKLLGENNCFITDI